MHTYIMSDIHGHYTEFIKLLKMIEFSEYDHLYILGDIMDRGTENLDILEYVIAHANVHLLMGNHEDMLLNTYRNKSQLDRKYYKALWIQNGEDTTAMELDSLQNKNCEKFEKYLDYLSELPLYKFITVNNEKYLLVHAGIYLNRDIKSQTRDDMLWIREDFLNNQNTANLDFSIIAGHTPTIYLQQCISHLDQNQKLKAFESKIVKFDKKIEIDCGAAYGNYLGCLRLDDMQEFYQKVEDNR